MIRLAFVAALLAGALLPAGDGAAQMKKGPPPVELPKFDEKEVKSLFNGESLKEWKRSTGKDEFEQLTGKETADGQFSIKDKALVITGPKKPEDAVPIFSATELPKKWLLTFELKTPEYAAIDLSFGPAKVPLGDAISYVQKEPKKFDSKGWNRYAIWIHEPSKTFRIVVNGEIVASARANKTEGAFGIQPQYGTVHLRNIRLAPLP